MQKNTISKNFRYEIVEDQSASDELTSINEGNFNPTDFNVKRLKGYIEEKTINNCGPYLYFRYRQDGHLRSLYLGKKKKET